MTFSVITEQVGQVDISGTRKYDIIAEMEQNSLLNGVLADISNGHSMGGEHYNPHDVLTELAKMDVDTSEAYSALLAVISDKLTDFNLKYNNLYYFREQLENVRTVVITDESRY